MMDAELPKGTNLAQRVFTVHDNETFENVALDVFRFQYRNNPVYCHYCDVLKLDIQAVNSIEKIPFLPISFFKTHNVQCGENSMTGMVFESSGTTGQQPSRHVVP